jgi:hypothetical protein
MAADGTDLRPLSVHETHEWNPSVTHDGRIVYTRWDTVDRDAMVAHLPWVTALDGRDARAVHGNFSPRRLRPDMEVDIRAIPGSPKYIATAAARMECGGKGRRRRPATPLCRWPAVAWREAQPALRKRRLRRRTP